MSSACVMRNFEADGVTGHVLRQSVRQQLQYRKNYGAKGTGCTFVLREPNGVIRRVVISCYFQNHAVLKPHGLQTTRIGLRRLRTAKAKMPAYIERKGVWRYGG